MKALNEIIKYSQNIDENLKSFLILPKINGLHYQ